MEQQTAKPSAAEVAQLRAEMRKRKILERGDERLRKLCGESKDETQLNRTESIEERNKNLIEQIIKDPNVMERINSIDKTENDKIENGLLNFTTTNLVNSLNDQSNDSSTDKSNDSSNGPISTNDNTEEFKPKIDLSFFDKLEKRQKLRQERLEISRIQLFLIYLINVLTLKKDEILINLFKIMIACLSSYFSFNIVTPFIISESIAIFYTDFLQTNSTNESNSNLANFKLSYTFIKNILLDSLNFLFIYIIIQALLSGS